MPDLNGKPRHFGILERLWWGAVEDYPVGAAWHPGGMALFVGDAGGTLTAFDAATGGRRWSEPAHQGGVLALAAHPERALLATAGQDGHARIWDGDLGQPTHALAGDAAWVEHLAWSPSGQRLAACSGRYLRIWDLDGQLVARSATHASVISAVLWNSDAEVVTASYGGVLFWDAATGGLRDRLDWKGSLVSMAMSPDGAVIACGSQDKTVHFWRRATGQDSMMAGYANKPSALAFDGTSTLLATSGSESVTVWCFRGRGPEGSVPGVLAAHTLPVTSLRFARGRARLASGAKDGGVLVWELTSEGSGTLVGGTVVGGAVESVLWRPDDLALAVVDSRGGVGLWRCAP